MDFNLENILLAYLLFAFIGWMLEVAYRSYHSKRITNPGFLSGPYLPIYGFGGLVAYFSSLYSEELTLVGSAIFFVFIVALIEYFTGFFFKKVFKIRLWDYSDQRFNIHGHACLTFLGYWFILGVFFKYVLFSDFNYLIRELPIARPQLFFLGLFYGVFIVDLVQSFNLVYRMRKVVIEFGENHISEKVFSLKNLYREVSSELNKKVALDEKKSAIKEGGIYFVNYFRLTRNIKDELQKVIEKKLKNIENDKTMDEKTTESS